MNVSTITTPAYPILSRTKIVLISAISSLMVGAIVLLSQWLIYDDWLHRSGPLRIVGTVVSCVLTFAFVYHWQSLLRARQIDTVERFSKIAVMNDQIRNSLQAIECVTFIAQPEATEAVQDAVDAIDKVLGEVLAEMSPSSPWSSEVQDKSRSVRIGKA